MGPFCAESSASPARALLEIQRALTAPSVVTYGGLALSLHIVSACATLLHQPCITEVDESAMHLRGLEEVQLDGGKVAAVLQEWLVSLM